MFILFSKVLPESKWLLYQICCPPDESIKFPGFPGTEDYVQPDFYYDYGDLSLKNDPSYDDALLPKNIPSNNEEQIDGQDFNQNAEVIEFVY